MAEDKLVVIVSLLVLVSALPSLATSLGPTQRKVNPLLVEEQVIWLAGGGQGGVSSYRIPLLSRTPRGHLVAVCEARKYNAGDAGEKFLAIRRSEDKGMTWQPLGYVLDDGTYFDGIGLGSILVDDETSTMFIFYSHCPHFEKCTFSTTYVVNSTDDGKTWGQPVNITGMIGMHGREFETGPGFGIQKKHAPYQGRLVTCGHSHPKHGRMVSCAFSDDHGRTWAAGEALLSIPFTGKHEVGDFVPGETEKKYPPYKGRLFTCGHGTLPADGVFCIASDDHGQTWRSVSAMTGIPYNQAKRTGDFDPDESQLVELPDGSIVINARNQYHYHCRCRIVFRSFDGGETFPLQHLYFDETLVDSAVAAGLYYHDGVMFFSNPANDKSREDMTLRWSYDNGTTWAGSYQVWPNAAAYSTLMMLHTDTEDSKYIYLLYEKGEKNAYSTISLAKISIYGEL
ncbi:exo-alpha-(2-_3)-sialidase [Branchiostoma belcheri]|nr:exo-alpha-(2->3)-sialidase [Branchiostoma belcheri]